MTLNPSQIAGYARQAGFRGDDLTTAVAVAMAESSSDPKQHFVGPNDNSYGLWQINMLGAMGPARRKEFGLKQDSDLLDPETNAKAAKKIFDDAHGSWKPWATYTEGKYRKYLDQAKKAVAQPSAGGGASTGGAVAHHATHGHQPKGNSIESLIGDHKGGFQVDPDQLTAYAKKAQHIGDDLHRQSDAQTQILSQTSKGFGQVGVKTGLAAAMIELADAVKYEMNNLAWRVSALAQASDKVAAQYRDQEHHTRQHLTKAAEK